MLKQLKTKEEQKERLGYEAKPYYDVYIEEKTKAAIFINKENGNIAFEIASEELPLEVIEEIHNIAKNYSGKAVKEFDKIK